MDMTKLCLNCKHPIEKPTYTSWANFKRTLYCSTTCGNAYRLARKMKKHKYAIEIEITTEPYEIISNTEYHNQMQEVEGLSRLYLDNKINLDTLRMMELRLRA